MAVNPCRPPCWWKWYAGAADYDEACNAADGAGQGHGADNYLLHIDSGVPGRVLALSHNRDLISLLAVLQINKDSQGQRQHDHQIPAVFQTEKFWKPSSFVVELIVPTELEPFGFSQKMIQYVMTCMAT